MKKESYQPSMRFCPNCGAPLKPGQAGCDVCGLAVKKYKLEKRNEE